MIQVWRHGPLYNIELREEKLYVHSEAKTELYRNLHTTVYLQLT